MRRFCRAKEWFSRVRLKAEDEGKREDVPGEMLVLPGIIKLHRVMLCYLQSSACLS